MVVRYLNEGAMRKLSLTEQARRFALLFPTALDLATAGPGKTRRLLVPEEDWEMLKVVGGSPRRSTSYS